MIILIIVLVILLMSIKQVSEYERGVKFCFGKFILTKLKESCLVSPL